jgi:hypothetical protein
LGHALRSRHIAQREKQKIRIVGFEHRRPVLGDSVVVVGVAVEWRPVQMIFSRALYFRELFDLVELACALPGAPSA